METKGKIVNVTRDFISGKLNITFQINTEPIAEINELSLLETLDIVAKKHTEKRSLTANSYFHVLVGKIADKLCISKTRAKNILICRYGQQDFLDDSTPVIIKTNIEVDKMLEQEYLHCKPCKVERQEDGSEVIFYKVYRGSHTLNSKEMSILINGTVQEAKELGIEVLPPRDLERLVKAWQRA
jgi:hypothetical protein